MPKRLLRVLLFVALLCANSVAPTRASERNLSYIRDGYPDLWIVEKYECRGACDQTVVALLEKARRVPQSLSDTTRRFQYDLLSCSDPTFALGEIIPYLESVPLAEGVRRANIIVERKWQRSAKGWWFERQVVNEGYLGCFRPDGNFQHVFAVLDFQPDYMVAFVLGNYLVKYRPVSEQNKAALEIKTAEVRSPQIP